MAEGWTKALPGERLEAFSAGTQPHGLNPLAVQVMREAGVDISHQRSKHIDDLRHGGPFDLVVTVCDDAAEACPSLPGARIMHVPFDDPPRLAPNAASPEEALHHYRRVRDEIRDFVRTLPELLRNVGDAGGERPAATELHSART